MHVVRGMTYQRDCGDAKTTVQAKIAVGTANMGKSGRTF